MIDILDRSKWASMGAGKKNYLGAPAVVTKLVTDFSDEIYEMVKARGSGAMSKDEMTAELGRVIPKNADIILGRNPDYNGVMGWNNKYALGLSIRQYFGDYWESHKDAYDNDPGQVLFAYLAAHIVDQAIASQNSDPDIAGAKIWRITDNVIKLILGQNERA